MNFPYLFLPAMLTSLGISSAATAQEIASETAAAQSPAALEPVVEPVPANQATPAVNSVPVDTAVPAVSARHDASSGPAALAVQIRLSQKKHWKRHDNYVQGTALRLLGARAYAGYGGRGFGEQDRVTSGGGSLIERGLGLLNYGALNARYLDSLQIGGDSHGLSYRADGQLSIGPRWLWTRTMGGVLRLGARGQVSKEGGLFSSDVRAPLLDIGVHHHSSSFQLDAVVEGAPVLTGFVQPPDSNTRLHGARALGGSLSLAVWRLRFDGEVSTLWHAHDLLVTEGRAWGCVATNWGLGCLDFRRLGMPRAHNEPAFAGNFLGISLLFGQYEWLHAD